MQSREVELHLPWGPPRSQSQLEPRSQRQVLEYPRAAGLLREPTKLFFPSHQKIPGAVPSISLPCCPVEMDAHCRLLPQTNCRGRACWSLDASGEETA